MAVRAERSRRVRSPRTRCVGYEAKRTVEKQRKHPLLKARDPTKTGALAGRKWPDRGLKQQLGKQECAQISERSRQGFD